jgi:hypothetical protein
MILVKAALNGYKWVMLDTYTLKPELVSGKGALEVSLSNLNLHVKQKI